MNAHVVAAKEATSTIPIVMVFSGAPVETGLIARLDRLGPNVTGTAVQSPLMAAKFIEPLEPAAPHASTVGLFWDPEFPGMGAYYAEALRGAAELGVRYQNHG